MLSSLRTLYQILLQRYENILNIKEIADKMLDNK